MNSTGGDGKAKRYGKVFGEVPKETEHLSLFLEKNKKNMNDSTKEKNQRNFCTIKGSLDLYEFDKIIEKEITSLIEANRMQTKQAEEFKDKNCK